MAVVRIQVIPQARVASEDAPVKGPRIFTANLRIYQYSAFTPARPNGGIYSFFDNTLSDIPAGWSTTRPTGTGGQVYISRATPSSTIQSGADKNMIWSVPVRDGWSDWGGIIDLPPWAYDGRAGFGLDVMGDITRNISTTRANSSNLFRRFGGGEFFGDDYATRNTGLLADRNNVDWSLDVISRPIEFTDNRLAMAIDSGGDLLRNVLNSRIQQSAVTQWQSSIDVFQLINNTSVRNSNLSIGSDGSFLGGGGGQVTIGGLGGETPGGAQSRVDARLSQANADLATNMTQKHGLPYSQTITVNGDADKYYPVVIHGGNQDVLRTVKIWRSYSETAPTSWNTSTHKGSLLLTWMGNFGGWGGAVYRESILQNESAYTALLAECRRTNNSMAYFFMLRGGGAVYHFASDQSLANIERENPSGGGSGIYYSSSYLTYDNTANNAYDVSAPAPLTAVNTSRLKSLQIGTKDYAGLPNVVDGADVTNYYDTRVSNTQLTVGSNGQLFGGGGGQVLLSGLGFTGDTNATYGDPQLRSGASGTRLGDQRNIPNVLSGGAGSALNVSVLTATDNGSTAKISIASHSRRYGFGTVSYNAGAITGLSFTTKYYIYCDDSSYSGGAVTYVATTNIQNVAANNGRLYFGSITTPANGGGSTGPGDDECLDLKMFVSDNSQMLKLSVDDEIQAHSVESGFVQSKIRALKTTDELVPCIRISTPSGAAVICSTSTPIEQPDGSNIEAQNLMGGYVFAEQESGEWIWERAIITPVLPRRVVRMNVGDISFPAGEKQNRRIVTHNAQVKP